MFGKRCTKINNFHLLVVGVLQVFEIMKNFWHSKLLWKQMKQSIAFRRGLQEQTKILKLPWFLVSDKFRLKAIFIMHFPVNKIASSQTTEFCGTLYWKRNAVHFQPLL